MGFFATLVFSDRRAKSWARVGLELEAGSKEERPAEAGRQ